MKPYPQDVRTLFAALLGFSLRCAIRYDTPDGEQHPDLTGIQTGPGGGGGGEEVPAHTQHRVGLLVSMLGALIGECPGRGLYCSQLLWVIQVGLEGVSRVERV